MKLITEKSLSILKKHIEYIHKNNFFIKNNYSIFVSEKVLIVDFIVEEKFSGNCWTDEIYPPKKYKIKESLVYHAIKILLFTIFFNPKRNELRKFIHVIYDSMLVKDKKAYGYYGNHTTYKKYEISMSKVYELIEEVKEKENLELRLR